MNDDNDNYESDLLSDDVNETPVVNFQTETQTIKKQIRDQLQSDIEAFLQQGGQVKTIADNVRADPPRKPDTQYGSSPL